MSTGIMSKINKIVSGGIPNMLIHLPPYILRIGRRKRSAIKYMLGTMNRVMKNAKERPKMIVHDSGFQNVTLSPPKKI